MNQDKSSFNACIPVLLLLVLLMPFIFAVDPITTATAISNSAGYSFSTWTNSNVSVMLYCNAGASDCNGTTYYCTDTSNTCDPTSSGTNYSSAVNISTEGVSYLRAASNSSNGSFGDVLSVAIKIDRTVPSISMSDDASASWINNDTISVSTSDGGSGVSSTVWIVRSDSSCGSSQDSDLSSGTNGTSMTADNDTTYQGKYVCFRSTDNMGNKNYAVSSQIMHLDTTPPSVDPGSNRTENAEFTQGASATDSGSGVSSYYWSQVSGPGTISFGSKSSKETTISADTDGTYVIQFMATDSAGNSASGTFTLVWETTPPTIDIGNPSTSASQSKTVSASTSKGNLTMAVTSGSLCDSSLSFEPYSSKTFTSEADNGKKICYKATDTAGNTIYRMSAQISGIDTTKPVISLNGNQDTTVEVGSSYSDSGASASDNHDGDLTSKIITVNSVNPNVLGEYNITYDVTDAAGNPAIHLTRTVSVVDTTKPSITLNGNSSVSIQIHGNYTDAGATAKDNYDGDITSKIVVVNNVNADAVGMYNVTYDVSDSSGNRAARLTRTVQVTDNSLSTILSVGGIILAALIILVVIGAVAYLVLKTRRRGGL